MINFYDSLGVSGNLNVSANTNTNAIYISQLGVGNAMLIEDSANPDATPFIINSGGSVNIGRVEYLTTSSGTQAKLQVNNSTSQIPANGLPFTTNFIVQGFNNNNIGFFTTDANTSQLYFGTPSSVYGAKLSWDYTSGLFDLSTQTIGGNITFGTDQGTEQMRIQSNGNVGIGTPSPNSKLHISGNTLIDGTLTASTISATTYFNTPFELIAVASDETTSITTGSTKVTFRMPCSVILTNVRASLTTAQTSGSTFTVDINQNGSSILSTEITIDNNQKTSTTATIPPVISTFSLSDDDEMTVDVDVVGSGDATGLKITLIGTRV